jgi:hypothetical protein
LVNGQHHEIFSAAFYRPIDAELDGMTSALASDVTITWLAAIGAGLYFHFLWRQNSSGAAARSSLFLVGVFTAMLAIRGFYWIWGGVALGRLVFVAATLLPIAITLFTEQLLRRHHPRWLKLLALVITIFFGLANLIADLAYNTTLLLSFLSCLVLTMICNAWFMLRIREGELSKNEVRLIQLVVVAAITAAVLAATDFRQQIPAIPLRLGAIGTLIFVCVMLNQSQTANIGRLFSLRPLFALLFAAALAAAFTLSTQGFGSDFVDAMLRVFPVAIAWILLTAVVVRIRALSAANPGNQFLHWLLHARMDTAEEFLVSLKKLEQTEEHIVLGANELAGYSVDLLFEAAGSRHEPFALSEARALLDNNDTRHIDAMEQLIDLLEKHEMTHALLVSCKPPLIVLLNLPQGANAAIGQLRAGVIQRLARRLANGGSSDA